jgi:2'-hydroxyisoflavone reductase
MKLLVLGGTAFLGRHVVDAAIAGGHHVTLFNRGQRNPKLFADLPRLRGDRNGDVSELVNQSFDAVIDCTGYTSAHMARIAEALHDRVKHYVFVSTISVYAQFPAGKTFAEDAARATGGEGYGAQKARAEETIEAAYPGRVSHVRPGLIVGPHDPTGRFTYWPRRYAAARTATCNDVVSTVLAPGRPERSIQWIDVRDLAEFCVALAQLRTSGCFNAVTPVDANTMGKLVAICDQLTTAALPKTLRASETRWCNDAILRMHNVAPWTDLPLWIPEDDKDIGGLMLADSSRAVKAGLRFHNSEETISATLAWCAAEPEADSETRIKTLTLAREAELLRLSAY